QTTSIPGKWRRFPARTSNARLARRVESACEKRLQSFRVIPLPSPYPAKSSSPRNPAHHDSAAAHVRHPGPAILERGTPVAFASSSKLFRRPERFIRTDELDRNFRNESFEPLRHLQHSLFFGYVVAEHDPAFRNAERHRVEYIFGTVESAIGFLQFTTDHDIDVRCVDCRRRVSDT